MEIRVVLRGRHYPCVVTFKRIKHMYLRVRDGRVYISCPYGTSKKAIESMIKSNEEWLLKHLSKDEDNREAENNVSSASDDGRHSIVLNGVRYPYVVTYKRMKNIYTRVRSGQIQISCPVGTPIATIESIIKSHEDQIVKQLQSYEAMGEFADGGFVTIFNQRYTLRIRDQKRRLCKIHGNELFVYSSQERVLQAYLDDLLYQYIEKRIEEYRTKLFDPPLEKPSIVVKTYKSRWGSCYYKSNKVSFNRELIHFDPRLIDYVVMHELCHFLEPSHSSRFYHEIEIRMPDYRGREAQLKEKSL